MIELFTIGFMPRERYAEAAQCLRALLKNSALAFQLLVIDNQIPLKYKREMEMELHNSQNVQWISCDSDLLPNQIRNILIKHCRTRYLCILENDTEVQKNWDAELLDAMRETGAQVAAPLIIEGRGDGGVHFDWRLDVINPKILNGKRFIEILPKTSWDEYTSGTLARKRVQFIDGHCFILDLETLTVDNLFDETLNTRMEVDLCLSLWEQQAKLVFEPNSRVNFIPPSSINADERDYYAFRWDKIIASKSQDKVVKKWNLQNPPSTSQFVDDRLKIADIAK